MWIVNFILEGATPPWCPVTRTIGPYETREEALAAGHAEAAKMARFEVTRTPVVAKVERPSE